MPEPVQPRHSRPAVHRRPAFRSAPAEAAFNRLAAPAISGCIRLLSRTIRLRLEPEALYREALAAQRPLMMAFWHEDLFGMACGFLKTHPGEVAVMVSRSRDGEKLARVIERLGLHTVRASSSRGAVQGFLELRRRMQQGAIAALALDGPRGPRRVAKPGAITLARNMGALVLPVAFGHSRQVTFRSWDRTHLPMPFCRTCAAIAPVFDAASWHSHEDELQARKLQDRLNELHRRLAEEPFVE